MSKLRFNISAVKFKDLDGLEIKYIDLEKLLGNSIYTSIPKLEFLPIAQAIHAGKEVELSEQERDVLVAFLSSDQCGIIAMVRQTLIDYLNKLKA